MSFYCPEKIIKCIARLQSHYTNAAFRELNRLKSYGLKDYCSVAYIFKCLRRPGNTMFNYLRNSYFKTSYTSPTHLHQKVIEYRLKNLEPSSRKSEKKNTFELFKKALKQSSVAKAIVILNKKMYIINIDNPILLLYLILRLHNLPLLSCLYTYFIPSFVWKCFIYLILLICLR